MLKRKSSSPKTRLFNQLLKIKMKSTSISISLVDTVQNISRIQRIALYFISIYFLIWDLVLEFNIILYVTIITVTYYDKV